MRQVENGVRCTNSNPGRGRVWFAVRSSDSSSRSRAWRRRTRSAVNGPTDPFRRMVQQPLWELRRQLFGIFATANYAVPVSAPTRVLRRCSSVVSFRLASSARRACERGLGSRAGARRQQRSQEQHGETGIEAARIGRHATRYEQRCGTRHNRARRPRFFGEFVQAAAFTADRCGRNTPSSVFTSTRRPRPLSTVRTTTPRRLTRTPAPTVSNFTAWPRLN